jgi:branched-chain amino acid transport system permease protein
VDSTIVLFLVQDAVINGAIYALVAVALLLVFAVTRVILVPQGEFVAFSALTLAALHAGKAPQTGSLLVALGVLTFASIAWRQRKAFDARALAFAALANIALPVALMLVARWLAPMKLGLPAEIALTLALVVPMGPMIYRLAFEPLTEASVLVLLIASFGVHFSLTGLGLAFFGPEGVGTPALIEKSFQVGDLTVTGQSLAVIIATFALLAALGWFFRATLFGKALRACASNRLGARLVGVSTSMAGRIAFGVAALIGAVSGVLIGAISTMYYDSGFLIGLKGFVAAIIAGLTSYAGAGAAAIAVGLVESFSSFWASAYKEVLVFAAILPVLVWRSLIVGHIEEDEE